MRSPDYDEVCGTGEDLREDEGEQPPVPLPCSYWWYCIIIKWWGWWWWDTWIFK